MLRALNFSELEELATSLAAFRGAEFVSVAGDDQCMGLSLVLNGQKKVLWFDLKRQLATFDELSPRVLNQKKPLLLFLKTHFVGKILTEVEVNPELGRILNLRFESSENCEIEIRLFPQGKNLIARHGEKQVSASKPQPLPPPVFEKRQQEARSPSEILRSIIDERKADPSAEDQIKKVIKQLKNDLKKKQRALTSIEEKLNSNPELIWSRLGQHLQINHSLSEIPEEFSGMLDLKKNFSWNLNHCFEMAKKEKGKKQGREQQLQQIREEIESIEKRLLNPQVELKKKPVAKGGDLMKAAGVKGRRREIDEGLRVNMGRSGKDNLLLLRRARPWHLWFHLKDFPGAHAVVEASKNQKLSHEQCQKISQWLIRESLGERAVRGEKYDVVWAEVRFVNPIKGDKLGRVRYQNENQLVVQAD